MLAGKGQRLSKGSTVFVFRQDSGIIAWCSDLQVLQGVHLGLAACRESSFPLENHGIPCDRVYLSWQEWLFIHALRTIRAPLCPYLTPIFMHSMHWAPFLSFLRRTVGAWSERPTFMWQNVLGILGHRGRGTVFHGAIFQDKGEIF